MLPSVHSFSLKWLELPMHVKALLLNDAAYAKSVHR